MCDRRWFRSAALLSLMVLGLWVSQAQADSSAPSAEHGRYLVMVAGCNDCHTNGYLLSEGKIPEKQWLAGSSFGWRGPWGTTYPPNLRLLLQDLTEEEWLALVKGLKARPPMPWFDLVAMTIDDQRSIYRYIRKAGPAGELAPGYVPPDIVPAQPYALFPPPPPKQ